MAYSVLSYRILKNEQTLVGSTIQREQVVRISCVCDTVADLPPIDLVTLPEGTMRLAAGSRAHIIATSADYMLDSAGNWIQQLPPSAAATYTKQEIDAMIQDIDDNLADLQQDLADIRTEIATDRSALAVMIDSGAKNIADFTSTTKTTYNTATNHGATVARNGDVFTVTGSTDGNTNIFFNVYYAGSTTSKIIPPGDWVAVIFDYTGSVAQDIAIQVASPDVNTKVYGAPVYFSLSGAESGNWLRVTLRPSTTFNGSFRLMICPQEYYAISHAFAPYRPSWQDMWAMIVALQS